MPRLISKRHLAINELFFEVLIAPAFDEDALTNLRTKKNRILLKQKQIHHPENQQSKSILNGTLIQQTDNGNYTEWKEVGGRESSDEEKKDLIFANIICKHLKSNAIALVKNKQLIGKGCGQTSRIDALRQAIEKAKQFNFNLENAVLASDAFFPFDDCVKIAYDAGITAFIQPGGSIRDKDSIEFCKQNNLAMVITGLGILNIDVTRLLFSKNFHTYSSIPGYHCLKVVMENTDECALHLLTNSIVMYELIIAFIAKVPG